MKCSACKNKNADSYKRIVPGHELFETLQTMSPNRPYGANSYFCEECLLLAAENLKQNQLLLMSNQNAVTVNITTSSSQTSNERSRSNILPNERASNKENNPQPKRTKLADYRPGPASRKTTRRAKPSSLGSVHERPGPASRKRKITASSDASDKSSSQETVQEGDVLLNVAGSTQNSQESVSTTSVTRRKRKSPGQNPNASFQSSHPSVQSLNASVQSPNASDQSQNVSVRNSNISIASTSGSESLKKAQPNVRSKTLGRETSNRESHSSSDDQQPPIAGPSAPIVKNPRIRQDTSRIPDAVRNFFQQSGQGPVLNVNNYSRSLAG